MVGLDIYYINVDGRKDRQEYMADQFAELGLKATRVSAITPETLPANTLERWRTITEWKRLSKPEIACSASHRECLKLFLNSNAEFCMIFEDDIIISKHFLKFLHHALKLKQSFSVLRFETYQRECRLRKGYTPEGSDFCVRKMAGVEIGAGAYLVSRSGAKKLLSHQLNITEPYDHVMFDFRVKKPFNYSAYQVVPALCIQQHLLDPSVPMAFPEGSDLEHERRIRMELDATNSSIRKHSNFIIREVVRVWRQTKLWMRLIFTGRIFRWMGITKPVPYIDDIEPR